MQIQIARDIQLYYISISSGPGRVALDVNTVVLNSILGHLFLQHDDRVERVPPGRPGFDI